MARCGIRAVDAYLELRTAPGSTTPDVDEIKPEVGDPVANLCRKAFEVTLHAWQKKSRAQLRPLHTT